MANRIKELTDVMRIQGQTDPDYLKSVERIYGTDSPEAQTATEILKNSLRSIEEKAVERAVGKVS